MRAAVAGSRDRSAMPPHLSQQLRPQRAQAATCAGARPTPATPAYSRSAQRTRRIRSEKGTREGRTYPTQRFDEPGEPSPTASGELWPDLGRVPSMAVLRSGADRSLARRVCPSQSRPVDDRGGRGGRRSRSRPPTCAPLGDGFARAIPGDGPLTLVRDVPARPRMLDWCLRPRRWSPSRCGWACGVAVPQQADAERARAGRHLPPGDRQEGAGPAAYPATVARTAGGSMSQGTLVKVARSTVGCPRTW